MPRHSTVNSHVSVIKFRLPVSNNSLDTIFGYQEKDSITIADGKLPLEALDQAPSGAKSFAADLSFVEPVAVSVRATAFLTPIELGTAKAIGKCGHWTVGSMNSVGDGKIYYIGTSLGRSIYAGDNGGIEVLRGIVSSSVKSRTTSIGKLRPRLIEVTNRGAILTVFNERWLCSGRLSFPRPKRLDRGPA